MDVRELPEEEKDKLIWSTGIIVKYGYAGSEAIPGHFRHRRDRYSWWAYCTWTMGGHCEPGRMEGKLGTRYAEKTLSKAVDCVLELARKMDVTFVDVRGEGGLISYPEGQPELYYEGDGEMADGDPVPDNWKFLLKEEAKRIGFQSYRWCSCPGSCQGCYYK